MGAAIARTSGASNCCSTLKFAASAAASSAGRKRNRFTSLEKRFGKWKTTCRRTAASRFRHESTPLRGCGQQLVIAAAPGAEQDSFLKTLEEPGAGCGEAFYLATIPHPRDWEDDEEGLKIWQFAEGEWQAVT